MPISKRCAFFWPIVVPARSFTVPGNFASRRVMEKLGMTRDPADDFDYPRLPAGHRLRRHVLYRLSNIRARPI
jgi:RimJ/RimL family protein N-acetyltransferase